MRNLVEEDILRTVVYFDLFSYPLTTLEICRNLSMDAQYREVTRALSESVWLKARVECKVGVWRLKSSLRDGVPSLRDERARRYRASKYKIDRARRFARYLKCVPWVQAVYACNSLGFLHALPESDIDLFIVARRGRIWSTRFFAVFFAKFFGRPRGQHTKDRLCLSFFAAGGADLKKLALEGGDVYYEHWLKNLLSLFERRLKKLSFAQNFCAKLSLERLLRAIQLQIMPEHLKIIANKSTSVILSDEFLKFHNHDRREYYQQEFRKRMAAVAG